MKKILLALLLLAAGCNLPAQVTFEKGSFRELQRKAAESSRLIFVDLYADWCGPCKIMDRDVFSQRDVGRFMEEHFVSTRLDIGQEPGRTLARDYEVRSIPTFLIFDTDGELVARTTGGRSARNFLRDMQTILDRLKTQAEQAEKRTK